MTLWLVRHAKPLVEAGVCYGALDLAADGAATEAAAAALAVELPPRIALWASPSRRCQQMMVALARLRPDLQRRTDPRLREMDFGEWEGVPWSHIPKDAVDRWTQDFGKHRFGGVESANMVLARVGEAWRTAQGHSVAWITHAGVIRATRLLAQGVTEVARADEWPLDSLAFGQWLRL
jgi:alpha-ribazole phosphatase